MAFLPIESLQILPEHRYFTEMAAVEAALEQRRVSGRFLSLHGSSLYYEAYENPGARASVVVVHGFTEYGKKYYELAWYLLQMGYHVFLYDQRGHGASQREVADLQLTHVEHFSDYAEDLNRFLEQVVVPMAPEEPIYLLAHSMGCAVALLALMEERIPVERAVLSSPMVCPMTHHIPRKVLAESIRRRAEQHGWKRPFPHLGKFRTRPAFRKSSDRSYARFQYHLQVRLHDPLYQNAQATERWMYEALQLQDVLLNRKRLAGIKTEIRMLCAGQDRVVRQRPQVRLAKLLPNCSRVEFPEAKHSLYTGTDRAMHRYVTEILRFFGA